MTADDFEEVILDVWPDVWTTFLVFQSASTQWRTGMTGPTGLDYSIMPWLMKVHGVEDEAAALADLRVMEAAALREMHKASG